jgi:putative tricarboxylic transport membrane protein
LILGELIENSLRKQIIIGEGSGIGFLTRPLSAVILAVAVLTFVWPMLSGKRKAKINQD